MSSPTTTDTSKAPMADVAAQAPTHVHELTEELPHIFDTVREPLLILGGDDLHVRLANPSFYRCFHETPENTIGRLLFDLGNGQWNIPSLREQLERVLPQKQSFEDFEVEREFEHIGKRVVLLNARKINNGRLILLALEDVTARRAAEEALKASNRELETFAQVASHDLKEPLRMVSSCLRLLKRQIDAADPTVQRQFHFALEGTKRMTVMIDQLLAHATVGRPARKSGVDCNEALQHALTDLDVSIRQANATVTHDTLPSVLGDFSELARLFQNLISNAIKYRGPEAPIIRVSATQQGPEWLFTVRDNGVGIRREDWESIFEMYRRLPSPKATPGSGIGLGTCKKIVESHGGRIWVESEPGVGSTFCFTLAA